MSFGQTGQTDGLVQHFITLTQMYLITNRASTQLAARRRSNNGATVASV